MSLGLHKITPYGETLVSSAVFVEDLYNYFNFSGTESLDSDGISIISESEEEELKLLPCNSAVIEDRPCSRSSNKYFDETDTASQHSMQDVPVFNNKKYKHHPNNNLNTSLNVLLIVAWAAVIGLGMGHFLGLQEECPSGIKADERIKIDVQTEELSVGLLKKLELENTALKEQFANLQKSKIFPLY
ncbi:hypothetical protein J437_LFUL017361 [Ladona fulva]|uniref:Uncharacterized protein n=1 Tax=Ladona fulva TaxID=123851 RepID=A0A8K0KPU8_LADFU|nr:hypothetical protein J437_LFUL017361 [Ladona fulva]